jgi:hypothetical protein
MVNPTNEVMLDLRTGLELTYPDEPLGNIPTPETPDSIYLDETVTKDALVKYQIQPQAKGLDGATFGIALCFADKIGIRPPGKIEPELYDLGKEKEIYIDPYLHGGGWLDQSMLADVTLDSNEFHDNHTYSVTVRPKVLGYIDLVPYIKTGDHVLLFDKDFLNRTYNNKGYSPCGGGTTKMILVNPKADHKKYIAVSSLMPLIISIVLVNVFLVKFPTKIKHHPSKKNKKRTH